MPVNLGTEPAAAPGHAGEVWSLQQQQAGAALPKLDDLRGPFLLMYHPARWTVRGAKLLPLLTEQRIEPGVQGVIAARDTDGVVRYNLQHLQLWMANKGLRPVPEAAATEKDTPDGRAGYVRTQRVSNGTWFRTPWESVRMVGTKGVTTTDEDGYWAWVGALVKRGTIPPPDPSVVEGLIHQQRKLADQFSAKTDDGSKRGHKAALAALKTLEAIAAKGGA